MRDFLISGVIELSVRRAGPSGAYIDGIRRQSSVELQTEYMSAAMLTVIEENAL